MKKLSVIYILIFLSFISSTISPQQVNEKIRIGIFDSRCVALVYGRSGLFLTYMENLRKELDNAKQEENGERVKELESILPTNQLIIKQQVFSTGSIKNIIEKIEDKITEIAVDNNLSFIISKWEIVYDDQSFELVDITDQLVELFNPDEQTLKILENVKSTEPAPIEQISAPE